MRTIVFLNIFRGDGGGGEVYLLRLINFLAEKFKTDRLVLISPPCKVLNEVSIDIEYIKGVSKYSRTLRAVKELFTCCLEINQCLKKINPSDLIINGDRAILLTPFLCRPSRTIGIKHMLISSKLKFWINLIPFCCIDRLVTISNYHVGNYCSFALSFFYKRKITMIYNSINTSTFCIENKKKEHGIIFIEIASLEKRKGQFDLLYAFEKLYKKYRQIKLWLIGTGEDEQVCKDYVNAHGLTESVHFWGFQSDIRPFLSYNHSVLVLPSYDEGLPIVLLEAMSCELPVISTQIAGIPEIIDHDKNGYMYTPGRINQLISCMEYFINNPSRIQDMGNVGRQKILEIFNEERWKEKWLKILCP